MKTRKIIAFIFLLCIFSTTYAQITEAEKKLKTLNADTLEGWKKGIIASLNLSQTSLKYWIAGGQNSLAVNGLFSGFANYKKGKSSWESSLDLGYGVIKQGSTGYRKTNDQLELVTKYGRQAYKSLYYAALMSFRTQFAPGYSYENTRTLISNHFAPAYLILALGLDFMPIQSFSAFISPLTSRTTFVTDPALSDAGAFGVSPGKTSKEEIGGYIRAQYTKNEFKGELMKNVALTSKISLFSNYLDKPQNIDVNWETLIILKVNKFISVSFDINLLYDDNIKVPFDKNGDGIIEPGEAVGSKTQSKEILGVGFSYKY